MQSSTDGLFIALTLFVGACAQPKEAGLRPRAPSMSAQERGVSPKSFDRQLTMRVELHPASKRVKVAIDAQGPVDELIRWGWPSDLDAQGSVTTESTTGKRTVRAAMNSLQGMIRFDEAELKDTARVELRYEFAIADHSKFLDGREFIVYPFAWQSSRVPMRIDVSTPGGSESLRVMTSLGEEQSATADLSGSQLRMWGASWGHLKTARFEDAPGRVDELGALGSLPFDVRWLAAELASLRSGVDEYFASPHASQFRILLESPNEGVSMVPLSIEGILSGLRMVLNPEQSWGASQRLEYTQFLVHKKLAGLFAYPSSDAGDLAKIRFEGGCARELARHIAFSAGLLSAEEYAEDHNLFEQRRLGPLPSSVLAKREAIVQGAAACVQLARDLRFFAGADISLKEWIHELRVLRQKTGKALTKEQTREHLQAQTNAEIAQRWHGAVTGSSPAKLPSGVFAPCIQRARANYFVYDFGFYDAAPGRELGALSELGKELDLRPDDIFEGWTLDDPTDPKSVALQVRRVEELLTREYAPRTAKARGVSWKRVPGIPDLRCHL